MERWTFNSLLFCRLSNVLDISITEIAKRVGIRQQVLNRYMKNENELPVQILIKLCNALRMPCYYFVSKDNNYEMPVREIATIASDQFRFIEWDNKMVEHTFGDGEGCIFWKDVAEVMGVTPQKPHDRLLLRTRFTVADFLEICNHFGLSPFSFLVDPNKTKGKGRKGGGSTKTQGDTTLLDDIAALRREVHSLSDTVSELAWKYQSMTDRYTDLLDAHKTLLKRFNEHIDESYIGIVAEDRG